MNFGRPDLLWLLLLSIPVLALHLLRRRRTRFPVPSLLLWREALARSPRRFGFRRLSGLLSLLCLLGALGAGTLAAADRFGPDGGGAVGAGGGPRGGRGPAQGAR
ncbi:MAG: BatA domain-containing protein [Planctomycetes bacterium]|nr:BatA domain-containing protein [Planctomycetota bacterium]